MKFHSRVFLLCLLLSVNITLLSQRLMAEEGSQTVRATPVLLTDLSTDIDLSKAIPWVQPDYSNQDKALGYKDDVFKVPKPMEKRVSFWIDIYTKYTTHQGLLHDSLYVNLVYESVDFTDITNHAELSDYQKRKLRSQRVKEAKVKIKDRLRRLAKLKSSEGLEGEDLRYWQLFSQVDEKNKFKKAMDRSRLRFQLGQSDRFLQGIYYSGKYLRQMEEIFKDRGLPIELTRLPFVESSFNYRARSHVGASGIWQFMSYSARPYLKMNISVDERNDPISSTVAAAKLLKSNFMMLGQWPLAVTGYNHGPAGVRRMVRRFGTSDISDLVDERKGRFGFASANFYASFLAALEVEKRAHVLFTPPIYWHPPQTGKEITLTKVISSRDLLQWFDGQADLAQDFNPHLRKAFWSNRVNVGVKNFIRVPEPKYEIVLKDIQQIKKIPLINGQTYQVARGDTLGGIARNFGVRLNRLMDANANLNPRRLRVGQKIYIPIK